MSQIKNFPHQYNDLAKLRATAEVYAELQSDGKDVGDDGVLGYALADEHIYRFRGFDYEAADEVVDLRLRDRIAEERQKPQGSQGPRTAAREMRRTMRALGWIDDEGNLTFAGNTLLETERGSSAELAALRDALMRVTVTDSAGNVSHPMRILLRLVEDARFPSRAGMELALVAKDDSAEEYGRILELAELEPDDRQARLEASDYQMANAVKILPALLLNTGLIRQDGSGYFATTPEGRAALNAAVRDGSGHGVNSPPAHGGREAAAEGAAGPPEVPDRRPRPKPADLVGAAPNAGDLEGPARSPEDQLEAVQRLLERTRQHQEIVQAIASHAGESDLYEDTLSYDLLFEPGSEALPLVLWEIKTVDGDSRPQVRAAIGQLLYYEFFYVRPHWPDRPVLKAVVLDRPVSEGLCRFMDEQSCGAFLIEDENLTPLNEAAGAVVEVLGEL